MGMALGRDNGDYFGVSYSLWSAMLELGQQLGWQPTGTEPPQGMTADAWGVFVLLLRRATVPG